MQPITHPPSLTGPTRHAHLRSQVACLFVAVMLLVLLLVVDLPRPDAMRSQIWGRGDRQLARLGSIPKSRALGILDYLGRQVGR